MGAVNVGGGHQPWVVARWAFRGYLEHVLAEVRDDPDATYTVEQAIALDGLHLPLIDATIARRLLPTLVRVADEVVRGARLVSANGRTLEEESQEQFRQAVAELRAMLPGK